MAVFNRINKFSWSFILEREQYEPFIDFIKGISILWVLWEHTMGWKEQTAFFYWGKLAVPLFLLIQTFHVYKKGVDKVKLPVWTKVSKRVVFPFISVLLLSLIIQFLLGDLESDWYTEIYKFGLFGPGGYYPLVYLQFAIAIPLIGFIIRKYGANIGLVVTLILSISLEIICALIGVDEWLWRLLCFRYLLLIWGGYLWSNNLCINPLSLMLVLISIIFIYLFEYKVLNLSPLFYNGETGSWRSCHWICYFYPIYLLPVLLYGLYRCLNGFISRFIEIMGKASYEIFLVQMLIIGVCTPHRESINIVLPHSYLPLIWIFSLCVGYLIYFFRTKAKKINN